MSPHMRGPKKRKINKMLLMEQGKHKYILIFVGGSSAGSCASGFGVCCVCKFF